MGKRPPIRYHYMMSSYVELAVAQARARLEGLAAGAPAAVDEAALDAAAAADAGLGEVLARFAVSVEERRVLDLLVGVDRSLAAARAARALSGGRGLTVELLQE